VNLSVMGRSPEGLIFTNIPYLSYSYKTFKDNLPCKGLYFVKLMIISKDFLFLLGEAEKGKIELINSFVLEEENGNSPFIDRGDIIGDMLMIASC